MNMKANKMVWNIKELEEEEDGLKTFKLYWTKIYRECGYAIVRAKDEDEARNKFWVEDDCEEVVTEDSECVDSFEDGIEEINQ